MSKENIVMVKSEKAEETKKFTYLVTGGAGFIGSNLVKRLIKDGHKVIVVDNFSTGHIDNLEGGIPIDIYNLSIPQFLKKHNPNVAGIFHLGIPSSSPMYKEDNSLVGTAINDFLSILNFANKNKIPLVYASSSSNYNGNNTPYREDMKIKVTDFYTEARYSMERLAYLYYDQYDVRSIGLRFFSVYGPGEKYKKQYANLITQFLWAMEKDESPVIYDDGIQTRDFIYVDDVVDGIIKSMNKLKEENICDIYNIGTGKYYSLNEVVEILNKILKKDIKSKYIDNPIKNYIRHTWADTEKSKRELGFEHKVDIYQGIEKLIHYVYL